MQMAICQICKEPVWSFICPDCLAKDIKKWLPRKISISFSEFHRNIKEHFSRFYGIVKLPCIHCKQLKPAPICSFCYIKETTEWLKSRNSDLAKRLMNLMSIASDTVSFQPVTEFRRDSPEEGICEYCGLFSNEINFQDGKWICKECEELEH